MKPDKVKIVPAHMRAAGRCCLWDSSEELTPSSILSVECMSPSTMSHP